MQRKTVHIGKFPVGDGHPVPFVAELGVNHLGDPVLFKEMIHAAVEAGADILKFQTYLAEKRYDTATNPKAQLFIKNLKAWQLSRQDEADAWDYARSLGATVFTSIFDVESLEFAESLDCCAYKLAAFEIVNLELVRAIASKKKPVVFSRGMATMEETRKAVETLQENGAECVILHTISSYPLQKKDSNLSMIPRLRQEFSWPVGHSDHTHGARIPPLAVAAGANIIEKHFTITPKRRESDNFFSVTPEEVREILFKIRQTESYMGDEARDSLPTEEYMRDFRRITP